MAGSKTQRNDGDVAAFIASIDDEARRADAASVCELLTEVTGERPAMFGAGIVGFGTHRYRNGSGKEVEWFTIGFAPRKAGLSLYLMDGYDAHGELLGRLGRHRIGKSCMNVRRLDDLDRAVLRRLLVDSVAATRATSLP
jgi:hypothetical protein